MALSLHETALEQLNARTEPRQMLRRPDDRDDQDDDQDEHEHPSGPEPVCWLCGAEGSEPCAHHRPWECPR